MVNQKILFKVYNLKKGKLLVFYIYANKNQHFINKNYKISINKSMHAYAWIELPVQVDIWKVLLCTGKDHSTREVTPTRHTAGGRGGEE